VNLFLSVAWTSLIHDKARMAVSLVGVTFAVILMLLQTGIYLGFLGSASMIIDHCRADLWILSAGSPNFESAETISEDHLSSVRGTPGVAWGERLIHTFGYVKTSSGRGTWAQIVGFNPDTGVGGPWKMVHGTPAGVKKPGAYIMDRSSASQLEGVGLGDKLENYRQKMEIVGICQGTRTNTTYPLLFTSFRTAQELPLLDQGTTFIVAKLEEGADRRSIKSRLRHGGKFDVYDRGEFSGLTRNYWATRTGIGIGIGFTVVLGFIVGLVIVGQTMYAATVERTREFATLKALGGTGWQVCSILWMQALALGATGGATGSLLAWGIQHAYSDQAIAAVLPPALFVAVFGVTLLMCLGASLLSVSRVLQVSPAEVFRS
jgi:putative ABC transport system permease protein